MRRIIYPIETGNVFVVHSDNKVIYLVTEHLLDMLPETIFLALSSRTRIEILKILAEKPKSVKDVMDELNNRGFQIKYRESVYRELEKLTAAGLVKKYYDEKERGIRYRLLRTRLEANLESGDVELRS